MNTQVIFRFWRGHWSPVLLPLLSSERGFLSVSVQCCWRTWARSLTPSLSRCFSDRPSNRQELCASDWETPPSSMPRTSASTSPPSYETHTTCPRPPSRYGSGDIYLCKGSLTNLEYSLVSSKSNVPLKFVFHPCLVLVN